ncbi:flagellar export chaperone FliS [Desulforamulus hydrothermalis]|uniref:Flagellar secretion chaperone FliS n=1 Tax=Desulforamulus hydrothermalis Lam5 = DSM 18033 TaxID=1121428 RepID=K8E0L9_9FIRM|nr:flagellar export chaperone FliS [Desulforamulus hydrothermalis]CCO09154.1 Flagellar protein fliS [Desulforamulus hydrothermalis Lam5 = DSM 18033]SHH11577.1 flagellar protein FliS [Desulforamulus hydrothermalis Lam5 = DSM 18033]
MIAKDPYKSYQQNAVLSAAPEELTTMLYQRLVKDLKLARESVEKKDIEAAHRCITHAQDIIAHLLDTLDTSYEVGQNLQLMYDYMNRRLVEANIKKDPEILREIAGYAAELRDTWVQAVKQVKTGVAAGS